MVARKRRCAQRKGNCCISSVRVGFVRIPAPNNHRHRRDSKRDSIQEAGLHVGHPERLYNLRLPKRQGVACRRAPCIDQTQDENIFARQDLPQRHVANLPCSRFFRLQSRIQPFTCLRCEPPCIDRFVRECEIAEHSKNDRRNCFNDEKPLPASQAEHAIHGQQGAGYPAIPESSTAGSPP